MAAQKKTAEVDYSIQEKIIALHELQKIDSQIDEINKIKGELPLEVQDLEDELEGLKTRLEKLNDEVNEVKDERKMREREIDKSQLEITRYKTQQNNVRNNREYDSLTKEIEYKELEIELAEKRIRECDAAMKSKKVALEQTQEMFEERTKDHNLKKQELETIESETADQYAALQKQADRAKVKIDARLLGAYNRIRESFRNGLAVVTVERDACGGCYNRIPPQRQADIRQGKKIIACEYCGRILVANHDEA